MAKQPKTKKNRPPKGKPISEKLREKDEAREALESEAPPEPDDDDGALDSEPPPAYEDDDDDDEEEDEDEDDDDDDDGPSDEDDDDAAPSSSQEDDDDEWEDEDDDEAAAQMGHRRYVIAGFFGLWIVVAYILGRTFELAWSKIAAKDWFVEAVPWMAAVPHEGELVSRASVSLIVGAIVGGGICYRYYVKPSIRTWADEVAEELAQVKWPDRKEVGNNTVVVIVASSIITLFLTLLDRLWGFISNLVYAVGS